MFFCECFVCLFFFFLSCTLHLNLYHWIVNGQNTNRKREHRQLVDVKAPLFKHDHLSSPSRQNASYVQYRISPTHTHIHQGDFARVIMQFLSRFRDKCVTSIQIQFGASSWVYPALAITTPGGSSATRQIKSPLHSSTRTIRTAVGWPRFASKSAGRFSHAGDTANAKFPRDSERFAVLSVEHSEKLAPH